MKKTNMHVSSNAAAVAQKLPVWLASVLSLVACVWAYFFLKDYYQARSFYFDFSVFYNVPWQLPKMQLCWNYAQSVLAGAGFLLIAFHSGDVLLGFLFKRQSLEQTTEHNIYAIGCGWIVLSVLMTALGFLQLYNAKLLTLLWIVLLVLSVARHVWKKYVWFSVQLLSAPILRWNFFERILGLLLFLFLWINCIQVFVPETFYDALVYHLAMPQNYLLHGGIVPMPFLAFSTMPQMIHLLWTWALALPVAFSDTLIHALHLAMFVITLFGLYSYAKQKVNRACGLFCALLYAAIPCVVMNVWTCGIDAFNNASFALAFLALLRWIDQREKGWWIMASLFCGFAISCKYTSIFGVVALQVSWIGLQFFDTARAHKKIILRTFSSAIIILALWSPWLIKNAVLIGNPLHPFLLGQLGSENINPNRIEDPHAINSGTALKIAHWSWPDFLRSPWQLTISGNDSIRDIGPLFCLMLPLLLLCFWSDKWTRFALSVFALSYIFWYMGDPLVRYLSSVPALALLLGIVLFKSDGLLFKPVRWAFILGSLCVMFSLANYFLAMVCIKNPWPVLLGERSRQDYLSVTSSGYPNPSVAVFSYADKELPDTSKILLCGENKAFYLHKKFMHSSVEWNSEPLILWAQQADNGEQIYEKFKYYGLTHLLVNYREAIRNIGYGAFVLDAKTQRVLNEFWAQHVQLVYFKEGAYLYKIEPVVSQQTHNFFIDFMAKDWTTNTFVNVMIQNQLWDQAIDEVSSLVAMGAPLQNLLDQLRHAQSSKTQVRGLN